MNLFQAQDRRDYKRKFLIQKAAGLLVDLDAEDDDEEEGEEEDE